MLTIRTIKKAFLKDSNIKYKRRKISFWDTYESIIGDKLVEILKKSILENQLESTLKRYYRHKLLVIRWSWLHFLWWWGFKSTFSIN